MRPDCILCSARGIYSPRHFHCFQPRTRQALVKALFLVLFYLIPPAHAPNHSITCNLCHTCMKVLLVEPLLLLPPAQPIVLVLCYFHNFHPRTLQNLVTIPRAEIEECKLASEVRHQTSPCTLYCFSSNRYE